VPYGLQLAAVNDSILELSSSDKSGLAPQLMPLQDGFLRILINYLPLLYVSSSIIAASYLLSIFPYLLMASSQAWVIFSAVVSRLTVVNVVLLLLGFVALSALYQIINYRFFHPLKVFPGPSWGTVTRLYITYHNFMGHEPELLTELHKKYGKGGNL
jgi:hypothetical protein